MVKLVERAQPVQGLSNFDTVRGAQIFRTRCSVCHGENQNEQGKLGPNLWGIGLTAQEQKPELNASEYILESILEPAAYLSPGAVSPMPRGLADDLSDDDVRNLIAFLLQLGNHVLDEDLSSLKIVRKVESSDNQIQANRKLLELGETVFRGKGKCISCHSLHHMPEYTTYAPAVFGVGTQTTTFPDLAAFHKKLRSGKYKHVTVTLKNGAIIAGFLVERTDNHIVMTTTSNSSNSEISKVNFTEINNNTRGELMIEFSQELFSFESIHLDELEKQALSNLLQILN